MDVSLGTFYIILGQLCLHKSILPGGYSELSFSQLFLFITATIFSCAQRNRGFLQGSLIYKNYCKSYSKLIICYILLIWNYAAHFCFLKTVKLWGNKRLLWGSEDRCETEWQKVKLWELRYWNSSFSIKKINFVLGSSLFFQYQHS